MRYDMIGVVLQQMVGQNMNLLSYMIIAALIATVVALGAGIASMLRGEPYDREHSGQLMASRVGFQGLVLALMLIALLLANS